MRTTSRTVTFTRPFSVKGMEEVQPAGTYSVETDEEELPTLLHDGYRRTGTWLFLPSHDAAAGSSQLVSVDPAELEAALARDARARWSVAAEDMVDDLLAGEVMKQAVRSAGLTLGEFKEQLRGIAGRLARRSDAGDGRSE
jgi:hypothetical protein